MGKMNMLNANIAGSMGAFTGQVYKGKSVLHARIWSRTPLNPVQKSSVRAFECLNRVAAAISRHWFYALGLRADGMLKHNAVARFLKPLIEGHVFTPSAFDRVFPEPGLAAVSGISYDSTTGQLTFSARYRGGAPLGAAASWCVLVFDNRGVVFLIEVPQTDSITRSFIIPSAPENRPNIVALVSIKTDSGLLLGCGVVSTLVENGVFYTSRSVSSTWTYIPDKIAKAVGSGVSVFGSTVIVVS